MQEQKIVKLTEREHILKRAGMYLGSSVLTKSNQYIIENNKFIHKEVSFVPGLLKIFNELIDNSIDEYVRTNFKFANKISITMNKTNFSVEDNGRGIPVKEAQTPEGTLYQPELAWTHARAGSNFEDDSSATIGTNGVGSMIASVFSKSFIGITSDGANSCTVTCTDNNESINTKVKKSGLKGTKVNIIPDVERFGINEITDIHKDLIEQRLYNLSIAYPGITFKFNNKTIKLKEKEYLNMFADGEIMSTVSTEKFSISIMHSKVDEFKQFSMMNGLILTNGGTHIDLINHNIISPLREKLAKKYKTIKNGDIKNKLFYVVIMKDFKGPVYETQTKEKLTNPIKDVREYFSDIDFESLQKKVFNNKSIINNITDYFRVKEEFAKRKELAGLDKVKKRIKSEKYTTAVGANNILVICEGQCLEENTKLLTLNLKAKAIKEFKQGDCVISGDGSIQTIESITKNLREVVHIKTKSGTLKCSKKHKWYVYIKDIKEFDYIEAGTIIENKENYSIVKSKINTNTLFIEVIANKDNTLICKDGNIEYTLNDYFLVLNQKNNLFSRVHATKITDNDYIIIERV